MVMKILGDFLKIDNKELPKLRTLIVDPPYYVLPKGKGEDKFNWDCFKNIEEFLSFTKKWYNKAIDIVQDGYMFIFWSQKYLLEGMEIFKPSRVIMWHYKNLVNGGGGDFAWDYDPIFVVRVGEARRLIPGKHSSVLQFTKPQSNFKKDKLIHPTQKPVELYKYLLELTSREEDWVGDIMAGSGTIIRAGCDKYNVLAIEKSEKYFNMWGE